MSCRLLLSPDSVPHTLTDNLESFLHVLNSHAGKYNDRLTGIFYTNAVRIMPEHGGLFAHFSRFNHACAPNAKYSSNRGRVRIFALRDIAPGEEIFVSYITGQYALGRVARQKELHRWGFNCIHSGSIIHVTTENHSAVQLTLTVVVIH
jgi:hypothetical protein